jgi:hypothetical protein
LRQKPTLYVFSRPRISIADMRMSPYRENYIERDRENSWRAG